MQTLKIADYHIHVGNFWADFQAFLSEKKYSKVFVLADENTAKCVFEPHKAHFPIEHTHLIQIKSGEINKNFETLQAIWQAMFAQKADRKAVLVCLGGGVIGDMGGFAASTFKRGIDFIQMPTTLLSQVDSSIGGKLGIDFADVKNSIGVFANPKVVFISKDFLTTLSDRELRSGFAEIFKHALIADAKQWQVLKKITDLRAVDWEKFIVPSLKVKQKIVKTDPFERGIRKALNFGHTIGHAIESMALNTQNPLTHGEAIAIGMICEAFLSKIGRGLSDAELQDICAFVIRIYGKYDIQQFDFQHLMAIMQQDKKNESAAVNFSLLPKIGAVDINQTANAAQIQASLDFYSAL
jgi:3-dehydroquinate synthase